MRKSIRLCTGRGEGNGIRHEIISECQPSYSDGTVRSLDKTSSSALFPRINVYRSFRISSWTFSMQSCFVNHLQTRKETILDLHTFKLGPTSSLKCKGLNLFTTSVRLFLSFARASSTSASSIRTSLKHVPSQHVPSQHVPSQTYPITDSAITTRTIRRYAASSFINALIY